MPDQPADAFVARQGHFQSLHAQLDQFGFGAQPSQFADLRNPDEFRTPAEGVTREKVRDALRVSPDLSRHAAWLRADVELGFDALYLQTVGRNQGEFIDAFASRVLPMVR